MNNTLNQLQVLLKIVHIHKVNPNLLKRCM